MCVKRQNGKKEKAEMSAIQRNINMETQRRNNESQEENKQDIEMINTAEESKNLLG